MEYITEFDEYNKSDASYSWISKYTPKHPKELIGNKKNIDDIVQWIQYVSTCSKSNGDKKGKRGRGRGVRIREKTSPSDVEELVMEQEQEPEKSNPNDSKILLITGHHGVGKTCIITVLLKYFKYTINILNLSKIKNDKMVSELVDHINKNEDILSVLHNVVKKRMLLIDEFENTAINTKFGKICLDTLIRYEYPLIIISNNKHNSIPQDIKKKAYEIKIYQPSPIELQTLAKKIIAAENINIAGMNVGENTILNKIIEHSQKDYRRLILLLQDIKYTYNNTTITPSVYACYQAMSTSKDEEFDLYKSTKNLLNKYSGVEKMLKLYDYDKVKLPLMIQQNYIQYILSNTSDEKKQFENAVEISGLLSLGDTIDNHIYSNQCWELSDIHGYYSCVMPSYKLTTMSENNIIPDIDFTKDFSGSSIGKINKKNIVNSNKYFKNLNMTDYIQLILLIKTLLRDEKTEECIELLKGYNLNLNDIESLLKIDKIKTCKNFMTSRQKKEFTINFKTKQSDTK